MDRHLNHKKLNKMKFVLPLYSLFLSFADQFEYVPLTLTNRQDPLDVLPNEIIRIIFSYLDLWQFAKLQQVSKRWYEYFADDSALWAESIKPHVGVEYIENPSATEICLRPRFRSEYESRTVTGCIKLLNKRRFKQIFGNAKLLQLCVDLFDHDLRFLKQIAGPKQLKVCDKSRYQYWRLTDIFDSLPMTIEVFAFYGTAMKSGYCPRIPQGIALKSLQMYLYQIPSDLLINCLRSCPNLVYLRLSFNSTSPEGSDNKNFNKLFCQSKLQFFSFGSADKGLFYENYAKLSPRDIIGNSICDNIPGNNSGWPPQMKSLVMGGEHWDDFIKVEGSLQQLERFKFGDSFHNAYDILKKYHIGENLKLFQLDLYPFQKNGNIWEQCPNLQYLSVYKHYHCRRSKEYNALYDEHFRSHPETQYLYDYVISSLSGHCPKLEIIELESINLTNEVLTVLAAREELKTIAFISGYLPDLTLPNVEIVSECVLRFLDWS